MEIFTQKLAYAGQLPLRYATNSCCVSPALTAQRWSVHVQLPVRDHAPRPIPACRSCTRARAAAGPGPTGSARARAPRLVPCRPARAVLHARARRGR